MQKWYPAISGWTEESDKLTTEYLKLMIMA